MLARSALALLLTLVAGACAAPPATGPGSSPPQPGGPIPFHVLAEGQVSRYDRRQPALFVLADAAAFRRWWSETVSGEDPAVVARSVAFGQELVIGVFQGQRPTGGYGIAVQEVRQQGTTLRVVVATRTPPPDALVPQVITSPYQIITIKTDAVPHWQRARYVLQATDGTVLAETAVQP